MNLYIKQRIFTWGDKFSIYDESGNEKYYAQSEVLTLGKKLHLYDPCGKELAYIEQQLLTFLPKYSIYSDNTQVAEVVKEFTFFHPEYTVNGPGWSVCGDFFDHDYDIADGDRVIASVSKEWFTLGDAYEISFGSDVHEVLALSVVLVIDACMAAQK